MHFDEITVGGIPALDRSRSWRLPSEQLPPECLQVPTRNPPGGRIDYLATHASPRRRPRAAHEFTHYLGFTLEVQVFGIKKSADTRKALRFFSERRIKTHFVDLVEKPASLGELRRFAQKFGVSAMIDKDSRRFEELGLRYAQLSDERWLSKLSEEPLLLRLPLVRSGKHVMIGADESVWRAWMAG